MNRAEIGRSANGEKLESPDAGRHDFLRTGGRSLLGGAGLEAAEVFEGVDVGELAEEGGGKVGGTGTGEGFLEDGGAAPGDVLEEGWLFAAQADEPVASVFGGPEDDIVGSEGGPGGFDVVLCYVRGIGADEDNALGAGGEGVVEC